MAVKNVHGEVREKIEVTGTAESERKEGVIYLSKPYAFEGKEYAEIDLSGLKKLTIADAITAQKELINEGEVAAAALCETTTAFVRKLAAKATNLPIEFFELMPRGLSRRIVAAIREVYMGGDAADKCIMRFNKPYCFKGKEYTEIDLGGIADLNSLNESEAENRMTRAGFVITENSVNYYYACILASMATNLPEEFFTGLPIEELFKLKDAVNNADFFE